MRTLCDTAKKAFEDALANAKTILAKDDATQEEVNAAWDALLEGIWGLGLTQGDKTVLNLVIERAEDMMANADKYMPDHWQDLVDALDAAKKVAEDGLLNAILAQRYKADKSILEDLIGEAKGIDLTGYTAESVATFRTALKAAQDVMADATLSEDDQKVVDDAVAALSAAMDGLTAEGETQPSDKPEATDKPEPDATQKPEGEKPAQTGDTNNVMVPVIVVVVCVVCLLAVVVVARKRSSKH